MSAKYSSPRPVGMLSRTEPVTTCCSASMAPCAASTSWMMLRPCSYSTSPAAVSKKLRVVRCSRVTPSAVSSALSSLLTLERVMSRLRAAALRLRASTISTKLRMRLMSMA